VMPLDLAQGLEFQTIVIGNASWDTFRTRMMRASFTPSSRGR
jgi:hypothetical protein